ncbi:hypothetical protein [Helcococcus kunzii]|uniref:hypothetical protein n=1 Tax=Helcococcus kunzii TaxID=40091 RepID=UPI0024AD9D68|nr:hypothetical protein [Helcococcus kunzii]
MNNLVKKFLENNSKYTKNLDPLLEKELNKKQNKKDFGTILAILGQKYIFEKNNMEGQYLSSKLLKLSSDEKIILTREHIDIINHFEKISIAQFKKFKNNMLITSLILSLLMFLIFYFVGKISLEISVIIAIALFLVDNYIFKNNKKKMFQKSLNAKIANSKHLRLDEFISKNI